MKQSPHFVKTLPLRNQKSYFLFLETFWMLTLTQSKLESHNLIYLMFSQGKVFTTPFLIMVFKEGIWPSSLESV